MFDRVRDVLVSAGGVAMWCGTVWLLFRGL